MTENVSTADTMSSSSTRSAPAEIEDSNKQTLGEKVKASKRKVMFDLEEAFDKEWQKSPGPKKLRVDVEPEDFANKFESMYKMHVERLTD